MSIHQKRTLDANEGWVECPVFDEKHYVVAAQITEEGKQCGRYIVSFHCPRCDKSHMSIFHRDPSYFTDDRMYERCKTMDDFFGDDRS